MSRSSRIPTSGSDVMHILNMVNISWWIKVWRILHRENHVNHCRPGYPSSPYTVRPFDEPEIADASPEDKDRMRAFNRRLSSVRIIVEHTFGLFKGRFPCLRGMGPHKSVQDIYKVIEALIVLHNIAIQVGDKPDEQWCIDEDPNDQEDENDGNNDVLVYDVQGGAHVPARETDDWLKEQGRMKRLAILDQLF